MEGFTDVSQIRRELGMDGWYECLYLVVGHLHHLVHEVPAESERLLPYYLDRCSICKQSNVGQGHSLARSQTLGHGVRIPRLATDDLDVGCYSLHIRGNSGNQSTATNTAKDGMDLLQVMLSQDLGADGSLTGNDIWIIERWDVGIVLQGRQTLTFGFGLVKVLAMQDHPRSQS